MELNYSGDRVEEDFPIPEIQRFESNGIGIKDGIIVVSDFDTIVVRLFAGPSIHVAVVFVVVVVVTNADDSVEAILEELNPDVWIFVADVNNLSDSISTQNSIHFKETSLKLDHSSLPPPLP